MPKKPVKIAKVDVIRVADSASGVVQLFFTSATEANKVFRRINNGKDPRFDSAAEALEPEYLDCVTTKAGVTEFLNEYCRTGSRLSTVKGGCDDD